MADKKPTICFVAPNAYPVLSGQTDVKHVGGAEVQQSLIARELVSRGYQVSFVTLDHGQRDGIDLDGLRVYNAYKPDVGIKKLRFIHPRSTGLCRAMNRANADIYYQRCADIITGPVAYWCRRHDRKFVFAAADNSNCYYRLPLMLTRIGRWSFRYGLSHAHRVVSQTRFQQQLLFSEFGLESTLIHSCAKPVLTQLDKIDVPDRSTPQHLLWVGRFSPSKRPQLLLDLADALPEVNFDIVGQSNLSSPGHDTLTDRARQTPNVNLVGYVPHNGAGMHQFHRRVPQHVSGSMEPRRAYNINNRPGRSNRCPRPRCSSQQRARPGTGHTRVPLRRTKHERLC